MKYAILLYCLCALNLFTACAQSPAQPAANPFFKGPEKTGRLGDDQLNETSGMAPSHVLNNYYWLHNDSGDKARLFLMKKDGTAQGIASFNEQVLDCEDIATGIGYTAGTFVYLGDIGDNAAFRTQLAVYTFEENALLKAAQKQDKIKHYLKTILQYPDGPRDAETLMVDPRDSLLYIVSKREKNVHIYTATLKAVFTQPVVVLQLRATIPHTYITAGDISADGREVLLKNYDSVFYWKRNLREPVYTALTKPATLLTYKKEKQGEAICFTTANNGFLTTSEGKHEPIYFYKRK